MPKSMDWKIVAFVLLGALGALAVDRCSSPAQAGGATDANRNLIAVAADYGNGTSAVFVIDTNLRRMAVYKAMNGTSVELIGARKIDQDLRLMEFNDRTAESHRVQNLDRLYEDYLRKGGTTPGGFASPAPADAAASRPAADGDGEKK
jgi:hypothetical protein